MVHSRQPLALIPKARFRKICFKTRAMGLKKKKLWTLNSGVEACLIISDWKGDDERPMEPLFWPSNRKEVKSVINWYKWNSKKTTGLKTLEGNQSTEPKNLFVVQLKELLNRCDDKLEVINYQMETLFVQQFLVEEPDEPVIDEEEDAARNFWWFKWILLNCEANSSAAQTCLHFCIWYFVLESASL